VRVPEQVNRNQIEGVEETGGRVEEKVEKGVVWIDSEHNLGRAPRSEERAFVEACRLPLNTSFHNENGHISGRSVKTGGSVRARKDCVDRLGASITSAARAFVTSKRLKIKACPP